MILNPPLSQNTVSKRRCTKGHNRYRPGLATWLLLTFAVFAVLRAEAAVPVVSGVSGSATLPEGTSSTIVATGLIVSDPDNSIASATVQISAGFVSSEDVLTFTAAGGITGSYNNATGVLTLTGVSTPALYQTTLRSVRFGNSASPAVGARTISFSVNDGTDASSIVSRNIVLNDTPVLTAIGASPIAYAEDDAAIIVTNTLVVADADNTTLTGATVSVGTTAGDILAVTDAFGISSSYAAGILTLTGTATVAQYESVLRTVTYRNSNTLNPNVGTRNVAFRVHDGTIQSAAATRQITVTQVNDAPVYNRIESNRYGLY